MDLNKLDIGLLDISPTGIMILDKEGAFKYANKAAEDTLGLASNLITDRYYNSPEWMITDFEGNPFPDENLPFLQALNKKTAVYDIEFALEWPNGKKIFLSVNATPVNTDDDEIEGVFLTLHDISHQVLSNIRLKESKKRYYDLFNNLVEEVHIWKFITDDHGEVVNWELVDVNPIALENWGNTLEEVTGKLASEIFGEEALKLFKPIVNKIYKTGQPERWDVYFPPTQQYLSMDSIPIEEHFISTGRDITERKQLEAELKKLSLVASHTHNGVIISDSEGRVEWVNKAYTAISGYTLEESRGKKPGSLLQGPGTDASTVERISDKLDRAIPFSEDVLNYSKTGKSYWIKLDITPVKNEEGEVERYIAIQEDITSRKLAEKQLRDSNEKLLEAQNIGQIGDWSYNIQENIVEWSPQMFEIFERDRSLGVPGYDEFMQRAKGNKRSDLRIEHAIETGKPIELNLKLKGNKEKYIRVIIRPELNDEGTVVRLKGTVQDITELMKALEEKNVLVQEVHHRVKNNLAVISGLIELQIMRTEGEIDTSLLDTLQRIHTIAAVHEQLYNTERFSEISPDVYFKKLINKTSSGFMTSDQSIDIRFNSDLPKLNINEAVPLGLLVNELLTNSIKHAFPNGEGYINIQMMRKSADINSFLYEDSGPGFQQENNKENNGFGMELIRTLISQLTDDFKLQTQNKFKLIFEFESKDKGAHSNL